MAKIVKHLPILVKEYTTYYGGINFIEFTLKLLLQRFIVWKSKWSFFGRGGGGRNAKASCWKHATGLPRNMNRPCLEELFFNLSCFCGHLKCRYNWCIYILYIWLTKMEHFIGRFRKKCLSLDVFCDACKNSLCWTR